MNILRCRTVCVTTNHTIMMLSSYDNTYTVFAVFYRYAIVTIPILSGFVVVVVNSFIINNSAADHYGGGAATIIIPYYNHCNKYSTSSSLMSLMSLMSSMPETTTTCYSDKSASQRSKDQKQKQTTFTLCCSSNNNDEYQQLHNNENNENSNENRNNEYKKYYRSISDVVGGLHGGKYLFGSNYNNDGVGDNAVAFSGTGSALLLDDEDYYSFNQEEEAEEEEEENIPNWVTNNMEPNFSNYKELIVPTNSNPMDGMLYFSSITIKNDERTWEKFYTKIITITNTTTTTTKNNNNIVTVQPKSGFLAPRGGTSNVCDINKPYSDKATICIIQHYNNNQKQHGVVTTEDNIKNNNNGLWLVVGTEEEKWSYKLILE